MKDMENKTLKVNFKCPCDDCNGTEVEEVLVYVTQYSTIDVIATYDNNIEPAVDYGDVVYEGDGASVDRYCCVECGKGLRNESGDLFSSATNLYEWLKSRDMLTEIGEQSNG